MKIYGNGRVWNANRHELAWEFPKAPRGELAVFETEDPELIGIAIANVFETVGDLPEIEPESEPEVEVESEPEVQKPRRGRPAKS